ncbi:hypothetical protein K438DRAFT_1874015 [Mycena galopus ATCC 62051]|nr:hypothetical protein K438DRAFT_1874015 [Mycena galopus ATCC 62051]
MSNSLMPNSSLRQVQKECVERRDAGAIKRRARKEEADTLRASHRAARQTASLTQRRTTPPKEMLGVLPAHASSSKKPPRGTSPGSNDSSDSNNSQGSDAPRRCRNLDEPIFPGRIAVRTAVGRPCPGCGLYDCPACACMCTESTEWVDHPGGHFFPDCKKCGGTECPGCACVCKYSADWVEHGGHVSRKKLRIF